MFTISLNGEILLKMFVCLIVKYVIAIDLNIKKCPCDIYFESGNELIIYCILLTSCLI